MRIGEQRGGALMLAVGYLAVMTLAASGFLAMLHHRMGVVRDQERAQWSRHLAEAGIEASLAGLIQDPAVYRGEADVSLGAGRFSVVVTPAPESGAYLVDSVGEVVYDGVVMDRQVVHVRVMLDTGGAIRTIEWNAEVVP